MTGDELNRTMEFLLNQQAHTSADITRLIAQQAQASADITRLTAQQSRASADITRLTEAVSNLSDTVTQMEARSEADRQDIREAINNQILANEVTRDLAQNVAKLAIQTSQRMDKLESRFL